MSPQLKLDLRESPLKAACDYCGQRLKPSGCTTGGGVNAAGETLCFSCCGFADVIDMMNTKPGHGGVSALYVTRDKSGEREPVLKVSNWPGTLTMTVTRAGDWRKGGFGSKRRTLYFRGPMGSWWSGIEYSGPSAGDILRNVRRLKS